VVQCTLGGEELFAPALLERSYCMLEGLQEVGGIIKGEGQTISAYQNNLSILPTLLRHRLDEHTCMGLSMRLEVLTL